MAAVLVLLQHLGADDVGGHQVGGELHPAERQVDDLRQRLQQHRLADAGDAFEEGVALGEQARRDRADQLVLADDDPPDLPLQRLGGSRVLLGAHCGRGSSHSVSSL